MSDIPPEVFSGEILSRLPAKDLLRLRCVCKSWRDLIAEPSFAKSHLTRLQSLSNDSISLILRGELCSSLYSLSFSSTDPSPSAKPNRLDSNSFNKHRSIILWAESCNGIVLSYDRSRRDLILWNPTTTEQHIVAPLLDRLITEKSAGLYHSVIALGFDSSCDDYRIVRVSQVFDPRYKSLRSEAFVYGVKSCSWKRIKDLPYRISRLRGGAFVSGGLHWICKALLGKYADDCVVALNLETEDHRLLQLPGMCNEREKPAKHLEVLGGCLSLSCYYQNDRLDVWLMKDYGVESSWIKLFSVAESDDIGHVGTLRLVAYSECQGRVLIQDNKKELVWFDIGTRSLSRIRICGGPSRFSSKVCLPSLVRLNVGGCANAGASGIVRSEGQSNFLSGRQNN